jgi:hypothetical protein
VCFVDGAGRASAGGYLEDRGGVEVKHGERIERVQCLPNAISWAIAMAGKVPFGG